MTARHGHDHPPPSPSEIYRRLHDHYGELDWWPARGPFQVLVGAVLTQRTAWRNVELAIVRLDGAGVKDMNALLALPLDELQDLIRPSGTYRQKSRRLMDLFSIVQASSPDGTLEGFLRMPMGDLREALLSVRGVGPETADSIILYAARKPAFVVDAYARRILGRLGVDAGRKYEDVAAWFAEGIPVDVDIYSNYHAVIVETAKGFCRKRPLCGGCPLADVCSTCAGASI